MHFQTQLILNYYRPLLWAVPFSLTTKLTFYTNKNIFEPFGFHSTPKHIQGKQIYPLNTIFYLQFSKPLHSPQKCIISFRFSAHIIHLHF